MERAEKQRRQVFPLARRASRQTSFFSYVRSVRRTQEARPRKPAGDLNGLLRGADVDCKVGRASVEARGEEKQ